jgi:Flp pilus assembly protein TadD
LLREAVRSIDGKDFAAAGRALAGALALAPDDPECLRLQGVLLLREGRADEAAGLFARALARHPDDALILLNLGCAQAASGNADGARASLQRACEQDSTLSPAWFERAKLASSHGHMDEARIAFNRFLELEPAHRLARIGLADVLKALGRIDEAAAHYRRVITDDPRMFQAWFSLVDLKTVALTPAETAQLEQAIAMPGLPPIGQAALAFALGTVYERDARHADACVLFDRANAAMRGITRWDSAQFSRGIDAVMAVFDHELPSAPAALGAEVLFVVSLPRSGSTLVEQILAAHPQVEGASELPDLPAVLAEESARRGVGFPRWVADTTAADWERLGRRYLERTARWRANRPRFTDKLPDNWRMIGAALAMLPGARVIQVRRDPLETCWSCYRQLFQPGRADYAYAFDDLAAYWRDCERLTAFWRQRHPQQIRAQSYEALVADPPGEIRALLAFCGLPFDPACMESHRAERSTRTASAAQVRQPLHGGTARSAAYGKLLDPLRIALNPESRP